MSEAPTPSGRLGVRPRRPKLNLGCRLPGSDISCMRSSRISEGLNPEQTSNLNRERGRVGR